MLAHYALLPANLHLSTCHISESGISFYESTKPETHLPSPLSHPHTHLTATRSTRPPAPLSITMTMASVRPGVSCWTREQPPASPLPGGATMVLLKPQSKWALLLSCARVRTKAHSPQWMPQVSGPEKNLCRPMSSGIRWIGGSPHASHGFDAHLSTCPDPLSQQMTVSLLKP